MSIAKPRRLRTDRTSAAASSRIDLPGRPTDAAVQMAMLLGRQDMELLATVDAVAV